MAVWHRGIHEPGRRALPWQTDNDRHVATSSRAVRRIGGWLDAKILAVCLVIGLTLAGVWLHGVSSGFIPCEQDCGETFDAMQYVSNYRLYGFRFGMVQDHATAPWIEAHPYFYTHNVNIGGIVFTLLDAIGIKAFWLKQLVTLAAFGAGLAYVYRATAYHTRSWIAGLCVLLLFVTDFEHVLAFGLSPARAWHWVALFGLIFHAGRLARQPRAHPPSDWIGVLVCGLIAFADGYDFWVICLAVTGLVVALYRPHDLLRPHRWSFFVGLGLVLVAPFILRQVQMMAVLGVDLWTLDILSSAAVKVPLVNRLVVVPPMDELDAIYRSYGVLRAPSAPAESLVSVLALLKGLITVQLIPTFGIVTFMLALGGGILASVAAVRLVRLKPRVLLADLHDAGMRGHARRSLVGAVILVAALVVGITAGLGFFSPHSLLFYLKHEFPLVAAPLLVMKGLILAALICAIASGRRIRRIAAGIGLMLLVADHLVVQVDDIRALQPMDVSWIPAVEERHESTFAVSWIAHSASVFTDTWAVGITPGQEREISSRISAGQSPFAISDFFMFGEHDADAHPDLYTRPDFWLYYPTDRRIPFDQPSPTCRTDYLTASLQSLGIGQPGTDIEVSPVAVSAPRVSPGAVLTFGGRVANNRRRRLQVDLLRDGAPIGPTIFNCQAGIFMAEYQIPLDTPPGPIAFSARIVGPDGQITPVPATVVEIAAGAPVTKRLLTVQPTPDELIALNPSLPVAARGQDYVIFDLRGLYRDR